jgi:hypothetical protein
VAEILKAVSSLLCLQPGEQQSPPPADSSRSDRARQFFDMAAERLPGMPSAVSQRIEAPCAGPYLEVLDQRKTPKSSGSTLVPGDGVGKGFSSLRDQQEESNRAGGHHKFSLDCGHKPSLSLAAAMRSCRWGEAGP